MAIERDFQHVPSGASTLKAYWRINSHQVIDAPQDDADRGVVLNVAAYLSRAKSREADSAPLAGSGKEIMILRTPGSKTDSGNDEVRLQDGDTVSVDEKHLDHRAFTKGDGYALLRKYHPSFTGAADVIETGQTKVTLE